MALHETKYELVS